ncbi:BgTH12-05292 [Blumeria graminis f. sp. triticale]|uniref:mRNA N(6)-methyladenine demethylase n=3 Tax=Blumeria graminis TaxID=34373 RepID=A0A381LBX3_BLUGR|nr:hypothetical protein BGT96224_2906 [Blumeria graminis f. sp. tritici 96224]CAD6502702.1 BgTH12-05292 [Blumeria graminis f. sp. triticale]VDB88134.1 Bgt-2906 [Blumeria graminis f. sp. tritici]
MQSLNKILHTQPNLTTILNPLEAPPQALKELFKSWRPRSDSLELRNRTEFKYCFESELVSEISPACLQATLHEFCHESGDSSIVDAKHGKIYRDPDIPGLIVAPSLFTPAIQKELLSRLLHRDLSNPKHKTNLHLHYDVSYPPDKKSFFSERPSNVRFTAKNGKTTQSLDCGKVLQRKLRWITLGGQYDWTSKKYPPEVPPEFPPDIARLIGSLFPAVTPQAAIINVYSPGDTLCLHRDVSEEVYRGLVSVSLGCDAYFIIGLHDNKTGKTRSKVLLLHSGDVLFMTGESRLAWHGVPRIIEGTCPSFLEEWPGEEFPYWRGWMKNKRINLNIRQMHDDHPIERS